MANEVAASSSSSADDAALLHKKAKKRMYDRRQQMKKRAELSRLQALVTDLEGQSEKLQYLRKGLLPWKDVAIALSRESMLAIDANVSLKQNIRHYERLAAHLSKWVYDMTAISRAPPSLAVACRQTSLPMRDASRHLGFDWITRQLFYNMPRFLDESKLPVSLEPYFSVDIAPVDDTYLMTSYHQRVEDVTLQEMRAYLLSSVLHMPGYDLTLDETDHDMVYRRYQVPYCSGQAHYYENTLMREFVEENRVTMVVQTVSEDEKYPNQDVRRDWLQWVVAERVSPTQTVMKLGTVATGVRDGNGFLPVETTSTFRNELIGISDPIVRDDVYRRCVREHVHRSHAADVAEFQAFLRQHRCRSLQ
ncbi:hypothetical protein SPRG_05596 [Saprolegnia parasitica CBS 223.65]|uniref:Uncharacterized protein n=1 Tax=Saprolegnia parasitica (strain CBS 223.65) TaxID=695850 RepID=A0A067CFX2_SAPPC|nr:hypothetical protein SPRG_05596 [Saprolegnia parasitica CBS 223.65]KDO29644.1 hypothetical protein SPRG_05596 [Saprolegnia parasitica CBS 223.65]|eukprot:XP_012199703.1 hypothetical protein SPRG_05596 [Saprolegnia parasitica CBS 223.65]